jgi:alpha-glucosidase
MLSLHKIPHPSNFAYVDRVRAGVAWVEGSGQGQELSVLVQDLGQDVFYLCASKVGTSQAPRLARSAFSGAEQSTYQAALGEAGQFELRPAGRAGGPALVGMKGGSLGLCGAEWLIRLSSDSTDRFFGMGEQWGRLEKSGQKSQFWNTDVWADYSPDQIGRAEIDACYVSIPYLIVERDGVFFGILLDTTRRAFMATNPVLSLTGEDPFGTPHHAGARLPAGQLYLGATDGPLAAYFLVGPSLRQLTQKLQLLVGTTPRPPLWALGHHQSRWGYGDRKDLLELDRKFAEHGIPCDGLWLDIDYMDGFRVFTTENSAIPEQDGQFDWGPLRARRRRIVPILDPGVKVDPGYRVYDEGLAEGHFCLGPTGQPYVGIVWPGEVHFPDFSQEKTRTFWASQVEAFARKGFDAFWVDMNDPSTGPIDNSAMLFDQGRQPHGAFHNEYALGMARATREGLVRARPRLRPFVLSRSGSLGIGREAAVWTGDNVSSFRHLAAALPTSINLALSGVPFNGPDVPGFGGDATGELAVRFYQAAFLFPFLRNHSVKGSRRQEPWAFEADTLRILRHYIRLRYRFLPYLYQLFVAQEQRGEPILGPSFIDGTSQPDLHQRGDQFSLGRLLGAPVVDPVRRRELRLPRGNWYCLRSGEWTSGGAVTEVRVPIGHTPLFVQSGTLMPISPEKAVVAADGGAPIGDQLIREFDLHVFLRPGEEAVFRYVQDDGETVAYQEGAERVVTFHAKRRGSSVHVGQVVETRASSARDLPSLQVRWVLHGGATKLLGDAGSIALRASKERFVGKSLEVLVSSEVIVD